MRVGYAVTGVFMGLGHRGLDELIEREWRGKPAFREAAEKGELFLFINKARSRAKVYRYKGTVLGYLNLPSHRRLDESTVGLIGSTFGGSLEFGRQVVAVLKVLGAKDEPPSPTKGSREVVSYV